MEISNSRHLVSIMYCVNSRHFLSIIKFKFLTKRPRNGRIKLSNCANREIHVEMSIMYYPNSRHFMSIMYDANSRHLVRIVYPTPATFRVLSCENRVSNSRHFLSIMYDANSRHLLSIMYYVYNICMHMCVCVCMCIF